MFCRKCGGQLPDNARFCNFCGADLNGNNEKKKTGVVVILVAAAVFLLVLVLVVLLIIGSAQNAPKSEEPVTRQPEDAIVLQPEEPIIRQPVVTAAPETEAPVILNGWYEENGKTYYLEDGQYYVGLWDIDGQYYFFGDDGVLQRNTTGEDEDGYKFIVDGSGRVTRICYPQIYGQWAAKGYSHGNNGRSSVMEYTTPIQGCSSLDLYVEAEGNYGSNVDGNWRVVFKIDGKWKEITSFSYSGSSTTTHIEFPSPVTIEAITAYPTKQGNASYSGYYELKNVWCAF